MNENEYFVSALQIGNVDYSRRIYHTIELRDEIYVLGANQFTKLNLREIMEKTRLSMMPHGFTEQTYCYVN